MSGIQVSEMAQTLRPASASIDMVITRADGTVEHQSVMTTYVYDENGIASAQTVETFGAQNDDHA